MFEEALACGPMATEEPVATPRKPQRRSPAKPAMESELEVSANNLRHQTHILHSQVMRIREEDQHLGEDIREGLSPRDKLAILQISTQMKDMFFSYSRPFIPSPLGMKSRVRSA